MDGMMKAAAGVLITAVLSIILQRHGKEYGLVLVVAVCAMGGCLALSYIKPVVVFLQKLQQLANLNSEIFEILLKSVGIGVISEIAGSICTDTGNGSLAKMLQLLSTVVILWLSLPIFNQVMDLIGEVLKNV